MIGDMASHLFVEKMIQNGPDTLVDRRARSVDVRRYFRKTYNVNYWSKAAGLLS